jgi:hypothetical protein
MNRSAVFAGDRPESVDELAIEDEGHGVEEERVEGFKRRLDVLVGGRACDGFYQRLVRRELPVDCGLGVLEFFLAVGLSAEHGVASFRCELTKIAAVGGAKANQARSAIPDRADPRRRTRHQSLPALPAAGWTRDRAYARSANELAPDLGTAECTLPAGGAAGAGLRSLAAVVRAALAVSWLTTGSLSLVVMMRIGRSVRR